MKPVVDELENELRDQILFIRLNIQEEVGRELAPVYGFQFTPTFIYFNGDRYLRTVPGHRLPHLYPLGTLINEGVAVAGSSDCPVVPPGPLTGISAAVTRKAQTGDVVAPDQGIPVFDALRLYTVNAAYAIFEEDVRGSVVPGKWADLVVLSQDPTSLLLDEIKGVEVKMTIIAGQIVWRKDV